MVTRKLVETEVLKPMDLTVQQNQIPEGRVNKKKPDEADVIVGRQIQAIRMRARVSREWLGDRLGITFQPVSYTHLTLPTTPYV